MAQPLGWLWGLAPLALLWGVGNLVLGDTIQQDVGRRALAVANAAAGKAPGAKPIVARVVGRDVLLGGEALSTDGAAATMAQLRSEFGVRRALGGLSQVIAQRPYSWAAIRQNNVVTLDGFVPDETVATSNVATAVAALPGLRIDDRQTLAFGAPAGFEAMTKSVLAELPKLSSGKVALDDGRFCVEGRADTPDAFLALKGAASRLAQSGFQPVDCALEPPVVTPYRWSVERRPDGGVDISGFYPSDDLRGQMLRLLRGSFPEPARIEDLMKPALGAPSAFLAKATRAISDLARLRSGKAELTDDVYALSGDGPEGYDACQALRLLVAQLDGPDSVAQATIACPAAPPPLPPMPALPDIPPLSIPAEPALVPTPVPATPAIEAPATPPPVVAVAPPPPPPPPPTPLRWRAQKSDQGLLLSGLVRDEAALAALRAAASELGSSGQIDDRLTRDAKLAAEPDYAAATRFALQLLGSMRQGAVSLDGRELAFSGEVAGEAGWRALEAALAQKPLPAGLEARTAIAAMSVRPYSMSVAVDKSGVTFGGYLPDQQSRQTLAALVDASPLRGKLSDETTILPGAPAGFAVAARSALVNLLRLDLGSASIGDSGVTIQGLTCRDLIKSEVETSAASGDASGLRVEATIGLRQTGCVIDPPNTCQNDLDALTKRNTVMFGQGTSVVTLDPTTERVIGEAFAILKQCPAARISIEGHANRDGDARGFNNLDLSQRRALRVRDELVRRGLDAGQLSIAAFGTERPLVPHDAADAKVMNRRVQFTVAK